MYEFSRILRTQLPSEGSSHADQLFCFIGLNPFKMLLHLHNSIEISTVGDINTQRPQRGKIYFYIGGGQVARNIGNFDPVDPVFFHPVFGNHQSGRRLQAKNTWRFWLDQTFLNCNCDGTYGAMTTHGQTSAGFYKENTQIILGISRRKEQTTAHHIVTTGFKHQSLANPIVFYEKMLSLFTHGFSL